MDEDGFQKLFSMHLKGGSSNVKFPVPKELEILSSSLEHIDLSIEYYLLARYAHIHDMHASFMLNTFWAVEHLLLSILIFKYPTKEELSKSFQFHALTKYWEEVKELVSPEKAGCMTKFDSYIGKVKGYFHVRYPQSTETIRLSHKGKTPQLRSSDNTRIKTGRVFN